MQNFRSVEEYSSLYDIVSSMQKGIHNTKNPEAVLGIFVCIVCISQRTNTTLPFMSIWL